MALLSWFWPFLPSFGLGLLCVGRCGVCVCIIYEGERVAKPRLHQFSIKETRCFLKFSFLSGRVRSKPKMTSTGYTLYPQQGAGKYEDSKERDFSQESEVSSQETESSQEKTENLAHWLRILDEATNAMRPSSICYYETQLNALINKYEGKGDSENVVREETENALLPAKFFTKCVPKKHTSSFKQKRIEMHTP